MDRDIWKSTFKSKEGKLPNEIAKEICDELYDLTNNLVLAKVEKYDKTINSMNKNNSIISAVAMSTLVKSTTVQDYLGEIEGSGLFTFEIYLTGINTPEYKYRICFMENGAFPYPVDMAIDADIAEELNCEPIIRCNNEEEFINIIKLIVNSKKVKDVVEGLMTINEKKDE